MFFFLACFAIFFSILKTLAFVVDNSFAPKKQKKNVFGSVNTFQHAFRIAFHFFLLQKIDQ